MHRPMDTLEHGWYYCPVLICKEKTLADRKGPGQVNLQELIVRMIG